MGNRTAQHAIWLLICVFGPTTLAGDDEDELGTVALAFSQKPMEPAMGLILPQAMEINGAVDVAAAAPQSLAKPRLDLGKRGNCRAGG